VPQFGGFVPQGTRKSLEHDVDELGDGGRRRLIGLLLKAQIELLEPGLGLVTLIVIAGTLRAVQCVLGGVAVSFPGVLLGLLDCLPQRGALLNAAHIRSSEIGLADIAQRNRARRLAAFAGFGASLVCPDDREQQFCKMQSRAVGNAAFAETCPKASAFQRHRSTPPALGR
jgi:hypothetical protein